MSTPSTNQDQDQPLRKHPAGSCDASRDASPLASDASATDETARLNARLNARRLSVSSRWRSVLGAPDGPNELDQSPPPGSAPSALGALWDGREALEAWAQTWREAGQDEALLSMLSQDEDEALGPDILEPAELEHARARFRDRMSPAMALAKAAPPAEDQVLVQVLEAPEAAELTVGDVVEVMERAASGQEPERSAAAWSPILEPMRASREALPSHITASAMSEFWHRMGLSIPREVSSAFNQAARLLLMGRAAPGARLSLARPAASSGISHAVAQLAAHAENAEPDEQSPEEEPARQAENEQTQRGQAPPDEDAEEAAST